MYLQGLLVDPARSRSQAREVRTCGSIPVNLAERRRAADLFYLARSTALLRASTTSGARLKSNQLCEFIRAQSGDADDRGILRPTDPSAPPHSVSGSQFQFTTSSSTTNSNVGSQVTGASLSAQSGFREAGSCRTYNAIIGIITLDATQSNQAISLSSVPISVSASGGATLDALTNCTLTSTTGTILTTGGNAVGAVTGANSFKLDTPLNVPSRTRRSRSTSLQCQQQFASRQHAYRRISPASFQRQPC